jgi:hypothetical protein
MTQVEKMCHLKRILLLFLLHVFSLVLKCLPLNNSAAILADVSSNNWSVCGARNITCYNGGCEENLTYQCLQS